MHVVNMAEEKYKIPLFDGTNFNNWKFRMETLLDDLDLLELLQEPLNDSIQNIENSADPAEEKAWKTDALRKKDKKCKSQIVQRMADSHLEYVKDRATAHEIWTELRNTFERQGIAGQLLLRKELLSMKFNPGRENLETHFQRFDRITRDLRATGAILEDTDSVCHLLLTMPSEYDTIVTALETLSAEKLTLNFVKTRLRDEETKRQAKRSKVESQPQTAFSAPAGGKSNSI